ncbi:hypothetical protein GEMRC1_008130 [Eukaryota sp. GEM-RC1]
MDEACLSLCSQFTDKTHINFGQDLYRTHTKLFKSILSAKQLPNEPWSDSSIDLFINTLSNLDTNNSSSAVLIGEREGRVASHSVRSRNYNLSHGVGRSGNLTASQPKAPGSSVLYQLTNALALDILKSLGLKKTESCFILPAATGIAIMMSLCSLRLQRPGKNTVLWLRCDQKSVPKAIITGGFNLVVIEQVVVDDECVSDLDSLQEVMSNREDVLAVVSTTSCFVPRGCDDVLKIGRMCRENEVFHVVNSAYGLNSSLSVKALARGLNEAVVDLYVHSTDKNFLTPVGGSIVAGKRDLVQNVSNSWPGRASISPILDFLITVLSLGKSKIIELFVQREESFKHLCTSLSSFASRNRRTSALSTT